MYVYVWAFTGTPCLLSVQYGCRLQRRKEKTGSPLYYSCRKWNNRGNSGENFIFTILWFTIVRCHPCLTVLYSVTTSLLLTPTNKKANRTITYISPRLALFIVEPIRLFSALWSSILDLTTHLPFIQFSEVMALLSQLETTVESHKEEVITEYVI